MKFLRFPLQPFLALSAILVAVIAQYLHTSRDANFSALIFFGAALGFWGFALISSPVAIATRAVSPAPPETISRQKSIALVVSAIGLALLTFLFVSDDAFNSDNVLAWLGSIGVLLYVFWNPEKNLIEWRAWLGERSAALRDAFSNGFHVSRHRLFLIGVVFLAFFSYYHDLDGVPAEMVSDHAENILDIDAVLNGARPVYFERNAGREPLDFYLTAAFVTLSHHPLDFMALKLVTATLGVLLVVATFFLARELFEFDVALAAAALVALGRWPVTLARQGLAFPLAPLLLTAMLFFLVRALKHGRRNDFLMTGIWLGLGIYGFEAFRIAPLLVALCLIGWYLFAGDQRPKISAYVRNGILLFSLALFVALPLIRYAVDRPTAFWYHTIARLGGGEEQLAGNPLGLFAQNLGRAALMFNWKGDDAWPSNIPGRPMLDYVTGALFVLGVAYGVYRLFRFRETTYAGVLLGWFALLVPSALSLAVPGENPSAVLASGAIPFVFIFAALPVVWTARVLARLKLGTAWAKTSAAGFVLLILGIVALTNYERYFVDFDKVYRQASWNSTEIASVIRGFSKSVGDVDHAWLIDYPYWVDARNVGINMGQIGWAQTLPSADAVLTQAADGAHKLLVLSAEDRDNLVHLQELYPNGQLRFYHARTPGRDFVLFYLPGTSGSTELGAGTP